MLNGVDLSIMLWQLNSLRPNFLLCPPHSKSFNPHLQVANFDRAKIVSVRHLSKLGGASSLQRIIAYLQIAKRILDLTLSFKNPENQKELP